MTPAELKELMLSVGEKPFRARQIYEWLHQHLAVSYDEMSNLPKSLKQKLAEQPVTALEIMDVQVSKIDGTRKYLFRLSDGNMIESVLMSTTMEILCVFPPRRAAGWDAVSAHPP